MGESERRIKTARSSPRTELIRWEYFCHIDGMCDVFGNGLLHELPKAVQERYGSIQLRGKVVSFPWFGDDVYQGLLPEWG